MSHRPTCWMLVATFASLVLVVAADGTAQSQVPRAQQGQRGSRLLRGRMLSRTPWWHQDELAKEIGVTADQVKKLDALEASEQQETRTLRATIAAATAGVMNALDKATVDQTTLDREREALTKARARMLELVVDRMVATRNILSHEQWQTLREKAPRAVRGGFAMMAPHMARPQPKQGQQ